MQAERHMARMVTDGATTPGNGARERVMKSGVAERVWGEGEQIGGGDARCVDCATEVMALWAWPTVQCGCAFQPRPA
eukprot:366052-Chlamydomonas_euryale.AAC.19